MDTGERMPKLDFEKESHKLTSIEKEYMQRMNLQNIDRVKKWTSTRRKNRYIGLGLGFGVISIYAYTMWAIKQERFLDDFEEPEKVITAN